MGKKLFITTFLIFSVIIGPTMTFADEESPPTNGVVEINDEESPPTN